MTVGMWYDVEQQDYANNYVVTFEVDPYYVWRPNANQLVSKANAESLPMAKVDRQYQYTQEGWPIPWSTEAAIPRAFNAEHTGFLDTLSDMLNDWWTQETLSETFPFTGIGYTYDWYYQDKTKWEVDKGEGLAEFVVMPEGSDYEVPLTILNVQTTAQFLGTTEQFPGVPEPAAIFLVLIGLACLSRAGRRRRA